ncbi:MAG: ornithine carbamoyltransferase [Chloroflexota bacterium]
MRQLIDIDDLTPTEIAAIWQRAASPQAVRPGGVAAFSFEGKGVRTRTTFLQVFAALGIQAIELPGMLDSRERAADLAGYLDPFYSLYVIRASDHARLAEFAGASNRPVINAMSSLAHPCEVLSDAFYLSKRLGDLHTAKILLWGPLTNVFRSWYALGRVLGLDLYHYCPGEYRLAGAPVAYLDAPTLAVDVVLTDGWPAGFADEAYSLTLAQLSALGDPVLLPTPPFSIGRELAFDPLEITHFAGYAQKRVLLDVQKAVLALALE